MNNSLGQRIKNAWNAFNNKLSVSEYSYINSSYSRPDRVVMSTKNDRSIVTSIINKISLDVSAIDIRHCKMDQNDRFEEVIDSTLNNCFSVEANMDQTGRSFFQDAVMSMLNTGVVALVPVDTSSDPNVTNSYNILTIRTGEIITWYPDKVRVRVYNDKIGKKQDIIMYKKDVSIIENPLYAVMNEPNSTLQRLTKKLALLDMVDERNSSGKLDLIIQLPYITKSELRKKQANDRRQEIEDQLIGSKYGIAYIDGTEKITQLNRPVENNLMKQIEYLTSMLYSQLGISQAVLEGTADEKEMNNYYTRTIEPLISALVDEMNRKFLTKTARSQHQKILYFRDPFKLVPASQIAEMADKFTRNEILSSNEVRQIVGRKPSKDPRADELVNSNISQSKERFSNQQNQSKEIPDGTVEYNPNYKPDVKEE